MEDFYRDARRRLRRADGRRRAGRRPLELRRRQPRAAAAGPATSACRAPWRPDEDEIDEQVRADLDRWERDGEVGFVGTRRPAACSPATRAEALAALRHFVEHRLPHFGPHEDAMLERRPRGWRTRCSSAPMNLGLLDPLEVRRRGRGRLPRRRRAARPRRGLRPAGDRLARLRLAPLLALRPGLPPPQRAGRRDARVPKWFAELDADAVDARCLSDVLAPACATTAGCTTSRG